MIWHHSLDPNLLTWGSLQIRWYGLLYSAGFIITFFFLRRLSREGYIRITLAQIDTLILYAFIGNFIGARLFYILFYNLDYYLKNPQYIIAIWRGGLSFHGALVGIMAGMFFFGKKYKLSFLNIMDSLTVCGPIGLMLGRLGNFMNGELFGRPTDGTWGIIFPTGGPNPRHPSQLYESFLEGLVMFLLTYFFRWKFRRGQLSTFFLIFYGLFRFIIEFFREPDKQVGFVISIFSMGQLLCIAMIIAGLVLFYKFRNNEPLS